MPQIGSRGCPSPRRRPKAWPTPLPPCWTWAPTPTARADPEPRSLVRAKTWDRAAFLLLAGGDDTPAVVVEGHAAIQACLALLEAAPPQD